MRLFSSSILVVLAAAILVAATGSFARAEVIAYDGFGTSGNLGGSTTGSGWSAAWVTSETFPLLSNSLAVPSNLVQTPTGGAVKHIHAGSGTGTAYRQLSQSLSADVANTWFVSFSYGRDGATSDYGFIGLTSSTSFTKSIYIGTNYSGGDKIWMGGSGMSVWGDAVSDTDPRFYIMKIVSDGLGTLNVYANIYASTATLPITEPTTWDLQGSATGLTGYTFGYAHYNGRTYGTATVGNRFDEYKITTAWSDIVVPEPSTLALLAAGLIGLLAYAWRKRK